VTAPNQRASVEGVLGNHERRIGVLEAVAPPSCNCVVATGMVVTGSSVYDIFYATDRDGFPLFNFTSPIEPLVHSIDFCFDYWNNIYVVNTSLSTTRYPIFKFDASGGFITTFGTVGDGSANGQCNSPTSMCFDAPDSFGLSNMYIVDAGNNRIQQWDSSGSYVSKWGTAGSGNGQFNFGSSNYAYIAFDGTHLYVGDCLNYRVQKFTTAGSYVTQWGSSGTGNGQFTVLNGIAVASDGTIYVVDDTTTGNFASRIQHFTNTGTYIDEYSCPIFGSGDGEFYHPNDIAIDVDDNIYVVDEYNGRIQKFSLPAYTFLGKWNIPPDVGSQPQGISVRPNSV